MIPADRAVVLVPLFNDWEAAGLLLRNLDGALAGCRLAFEVLLIDDGSTLPAPPNFGVGPFDTLQSVSVLHLRRNLGHQRAIAVGLVFIYQHLPSAAVVVMDGDGEDRPADIPTLLRRFDEQQGRSIVFAARGKRLEGWAFRALYQIYRVLHVAITGDPVRVGNFSIVPFESLSKLVVVPEIWNHYAAAVIRSRLVFESIPIARGRRLVGESKMNFVSLLLHGLSAFFVYGDIVGARLLVGIAIALVMEIAIVVTGLGVQFGTSFTTPGLFVYLAAILGIVLLQAIPIALILVFTVVGSRVNIGFLPLRDCPYFVSTLERVWPTSEA